MKYPSECGILFRAPMVRALLAEQKDQTRRVVTARNSLLDGHPASRAVWARLVFTPDGHPFPGLPRVDPGPSPAGNPGPYLHVPLRPHPSDNQDDPELWTVRRVYPRFHPGGRLWGRETWAEHPDGEGIIYRATDPAWDAEKTGVRWRPSIFMPRWASRILLEVTEVRVQRVQDISEADAEAEGAPCAHVPDLGHTFKTYRAGFEALWDSINAKRGYGWEANPWVWVLKLKPLEGEGHGQEG